MKLLGSVTSSVTYPYIETYTYLVIRVEIPFFHVITPLRQQRADIGGHVFHLSLFHA